MTSERAAQLVRAWVRLYTASLPSDVARRRREEIEADVHDHLAHERDVDTPDGFVARDIVWRMARGMPADISWRRHVAHQKGDSVKTFVLVLVVALAVAAAAFVTDSALLVLVSVALMGADIVAMSALTLRSAYRANVAVPFVVVMAAALGGAALGVAAIVLGGRWDAPGLVLLGTVLIVSVIVGVFAFGMRSAERSK